MALGTDGLITVVGDVDTITDSTASGTLTVELSDKLIVGSKVYLPIERQVQLNSTDGTFSIKLPPTDNTQVTYRFTLIAYSLVNGQREHYTETFDAVVTAATADSSGVIQYKDLTVVASPGVPQTYLTRTVADLRYALKGEGGGAGGGGSLDAEAVRDLIGGVLVAGANVSIAVDDTANTVTISSTGGTGGGGGSTTVASITDATTVGKAVLLAASAAAARTSLDAAQTTHTHTSSQVTDFIEASQDATAAMIRAGSNVTIAYDDTANTFTINSTAGGGGTTDAEIVRDTIAGALVGGANLQITVNDAADTITLAVTGLATVATTGAYGDLTGKPTIPAAYTDEQAQDAAAALFAAGAHVGATVTYDDTNNKLSVAVLYPTGTLLFAARQPEVLATGALTYNTSGALTGAGVVWPDGATGTYTGTANATFGGSIDSYTITHVLAGTTTTTYTQPAVTRDATTGQVTTRPAVTVA